MQPFDIAIHVAHALPSARAQHGTTTTYLRIPSWRKEESPDQFTAPMRRFSVPVRRFSFSPRPLKAIAEGASKGSLLRRASEYEALRVRLYGSSLADRNVARAWTVWRAYGCTGGCCGHCGHRSGPPRRLQVSQTSTGVATISLNRPTKAALNRLAGILAGWRRGVFRLAVLVQRNAMNMRMWEELVDVWPTVDLDSSVRCVILAGEGPAWCSGMDLAVFAEVCHH